MRRRCKGKRGCSQAVDEPFRRRLNHGRCALFAYLYYMLGNPAHLREKSLREGASMSDVILPGVGSQENQPPELLKENSLAQVTTVDTGFPVAERNAYCNQLAGQDV